MGLFLLQRGGGGRGESEVLGSLEDNGAFLAGESGWPWTKQGALQKDFEKGMKISFWELSLKNGLENYGPSSGQILSATCMV